MDIASSIEAATAFLIDARDRKGWWRDFDTLAGPSDEWVTAYVGVALATLTNRAASKAVSDAWALLRKRRWWSSGWGYNAWVPADADTTAWVLQLAESVGASRSIRARRARRFLAKHIRPSGGIATYADDGPIRYFTRLQRHISFRGWCRVHPCVTATVAGLLELPSRRRMINYLRNTQCQDGSWISYWWCDREYATALVAEELSSDAQPENFEWVESAVNWAQNRVNSNGAVSSVNRPSGSPFATAWCLRILVLAEDMNSIREQLEVSIDWLLRHQKPDGSWPSSAALRIPPPDVTEPENYQEWILNGRGGGSIVYDQQNIFTTATVVRAMEIVRAGIEGDENVIHK